MIRLAQESHTRRRALRSNVRRRAGDYRACITNRVWCVHMPFDCAGGCWGQRPRGACGGQSQHMVLAALAPTPPTPSGVPVLDYAHGELQHDCSSKPMFQHCTCQLCFLVMCWNVYVCEECTCAACVLLAD